MAKIRRKLTKGERIGLEVLNGIRELKRGGGKVYHVVASAKPAKKPIRGKPRSSGKS